MYQMLIEDKYNKVRYLSSIVVTDQEIQKNGLKVAAQMEHLQRNPDDKMLQDEYIEDIFKEINIVGLVPVEGLRTVRL